MPEQPQPQPTFTMTTTRVGEGTSLTYRDIAGHFTIQVPHYLQIRILERLKAAGYQHISYRQWTDLLTGACHKEIAHNMAARFKEQWQHNVAACDEEVANAMVTLFCDAFYVHLQRWKWEHEADVDLDYVIEEITNNEEEVIDYTKLPEGQPRMTPGNLDLVTDEREFLKEIQELSERQ